MGNKRLENLLKSGKVPIKGGGMVRCLQSSSLRHCGDDNGRGVVPMPDFCNNYDE